jgi:eukaryotic-like serine/threonine-protein kinase
MADLSGVLVANRYLVSSLVASGGMASVYLAQDTVLERRVALKVIHPHLAGDKSFVDKFRREAKMAAKLSHPNLVNVFDQGTDGQIIFLVMEYVPGITLRDAMNDFGALDAKKTLDIIQPLTAGLAKAHSAGILHRDIKPENVFLSDDGSVKLGDFGLARAISSHTQTGSVVGTVAYLSPELVLRGQADARSDVYSLGVMIFEMLTGRQPYQGEQPVQIAYQHANNRIPAPSLINNAVPELLDEIVLWCTARQPADRPINAAALLAVIERAKKDLSKGITTSLEDIDSTICLDLGEDLPRNANATEILSELELSKPTYSSDAAVKLQKGNKRAGILIWLITLLAIFGGGGAGWWFSLGPGGQATIPELSGRSVDTGREALSPIGLNIEISQEHNKEVAEGLIIRTDPQAGSRVFKNSTVTVIVSLGPLQVQVPQLTGLDLTEATAKIQQAGLNLGKVDYYFDQAPANQVLGQSLAPASMLDQDSPVDLLVSEGALPDLAGVEIEQARQLLRDLAVEISEQEVFNNRIPAGQVVSLIPSTKPLPRGGKATLEISKGPEIVIMPNVVSETIAAAEKLLENLGLEVVIDTNSLRSNYGIARVQRQTPAAGSQVRFGDKVTIVSR